MGCHPERGLPFAKQTAASEGPMYYQPPSYASTTKSESGCAPSDVHPQEARASRSESKTAPIANRGCSKTKYTRGCLPALIIARRSAISSALKLDPIRNAATPMARHRPNIVNEASKGKDSASKQSGKPAQTPVILSAVCRLQSKRQQAKDLCIAIHAPIYMSQQRYRHRAAYPRTVIGRSRRLLVVEAELPRTANRVVQGLRARP